MVDCIKIRGAKVHNLKNINVDIPLGKIVAIAGVSGSGKSSLALGILYAEGSRRYLEALSTYTRRRITQTEKAKVDIIEHVPAALALHQRPNIPGIRSTFGTSTELLNSLRLLYSRCGNYICPNGHKLEASMNIARELPLTCPECGEEFYGLGAEEYAFNSDGACQKCSGTGFVRDVDVTKLVPDDTLTLEEGAVKPWSKFGISWMYLVAAELGVRTDVPFRDLTDEEKEIVYYGEPVKRYVAIPSKNGKLFDLNAEYRNAISAVKESLNKAKSEKGLSRINQYLEIKTCSECNGSRINNRANSTLLNDINITEASQKTLEQLVKWIPESIETLPSEMRGMAESISEEFMDNAEALLKLGLGYLTLDRPSSTLSTGELQRVQLARTIRNPTTGVLYVLDEPSIGLHPSNIDGLIHVMKELVLNGNSVILVDHDTRILEVADYLVEIGPASGVDGGELVTQGTIDEIKKDKDSIIGPYIAQEEEIVVRDKYDEDELFDEGIITLSTRPLHTVKELYLEIPKGRFNVVTGVSGSGKTTLILESLYPAIKASLDGEALPEHIDYVDYDNINKIHLIDATPIGKNVRSTLATYSGVLTNLRKLYADQPKARELQYTLKDFSYNTGKLRCSTCNGTGRISMDVQFLPDVEIDCPDCEALRYSRKAEQITYQGFSIKDAMALTIDEAIGVYELEDKIYTKLKTLQDIGLGYLTLGESTPELSGGEAQRLKLASHMGRKQKNTLFIFDEPTIGLHPEDVKQLIHVMDELVTNGATVIIIEHDLDLIKNADYIIDMGPGGGLEGGQIVCTGTLDEVLENDDSITAQYLKS
ncbi:excinuclease ABC subunit UvrA [Methanosphaera sp. ISO3-F5]|uniref:excinuclease ABC subunit UvrA n=1 Tax=Methanosphaera sp. ISO3-F5 TaxID=1452353 RepID=UPI002B25F51D|nr:excinuclease ABC subunit UvrA [Methanosphaera sp. ISO3-F5]WQH63926.1 ATP-binding cassette domain-containing protein [Methanosphaera sp. ISO3-F5]